MKKTLVLTTILSGLTCAANAQELTVMSFGGAYGAAQTETHVMPFAAATGFPAKMVDSDNPAAPLKAMIEAEDAKAILSDETIAQKLSAEGHDIARRTALQPFTDRAHCAKLSAKFNAFTCRYSMQQVLRSTCAENVHMRPLLLELRAGYFDNVCPFVDVVLHIFRECFRRHLHGRCALF